MLIEKFKFNCLALFVKQPIFEFIKRTVDIGVSRVYIDILPVLYLTITF